MQICSGAPEVTVFLHALDAHSVVSISMPFDFPSTLLRRFSTLSRDLMRTLTPSFSTSGNDAISEYLRNPRRRQDSSFWIFCPIQSPIGDVAVPAASIRPRGLLAITPISGLRSVQHQDLYCCAVSKVYLWTRERPPYGSDALSTPTPCNALGGVRRRRHLDTGSNHGFTSLLCSSWSMGPCGNDHLGI